MVTLTLLSAASCPKQLKPTLRSFLSSYNDPKLLILLYLVSLLSLLRNRTFNLSAEFNPVGVVLPPCRSGTLSSSLCSRQPIHNHYSRLPRIPRAQCLWRRSHTLLQYGEGGASPFWRHRHVPYRPRHQSPLELSTRLR